MACLSCEHFDEKHEDRQGKCLEVGCKCLALHKSILGGMTDRRFACPNCAELLIIPITITFQEPRVSVANVTPTTSWIDHLSPGQKALMEMLEEIGAVRAFSEAIEAATFDNNKPSNPAKSLFSFLQKAAPRTVPSHVLNHFRTRYPNQYVQFFGFNAIAAAVVSGKIVRFIPYDFIRTRQMGAGQGVNRIKLEKSVSDVDFEAWIRTKFGYVAADGDGLMLSTLRQRSIGDLAKLVQ